MALWHNKNVASQFVSVLTYDIFWHSLLATFVVLTNLYQQSIIIFLAERTESIYTSIIISTMNITKTTFIMILAVALASFISVVEGGVDEGGVVERGVLERGVVEIAEESGGDGCETRGLRKLHRCGCCWLCFKCKRRCRPKRSCGCFTC